LRRGEIKPLRSPPHHAKAAATRAGIWGPRSSAAAASSTAPGSSLAESAHDPRHRIAATTETPPAGCLFWRQRVEQRHRATAARQLLASDALSGSARAKALARQSGVR
jgi:hypothetical protein